MLPLWCRVHKPKRAPLLSAVDKIHASGQMSPCQERVAPFMYKLIRKLLGSQRLGNGLALGHSRVETINIFSREKCALNKGWPWKGALEGVVGRR